MKFWLKSDLAKGAALAGLASFLIGIASNGSKLAIQEGATAELLTLCRLVVGMMLLGSALILRRKKLQLHKNTIILGFVVGVMITVETVFLMQAIARIPVSVAIILLFTFPVWTAIATRFTDGIVLTKIHFFSVILALVGVAVTVGVKFESLDIIGIAMALVASLGTTFALIYNVKLSRTIGPFPTMFLMMGFGSVIYGFYSLIASPSLIWPLTNLGWIGLLGSSVIFVAGASVIIIAYLFIDAPRASLISNLQPIFTILIAVLFLRESFSILQVMGAVLVLIAISLPNLFPLLHESKFFVEKT